MSVKCPKCQTDNPSDSKFCKECATPIPFAGDISVTKTLETPAKGLALGSTFAGRYQIVAELGKGGMGAVYKALDTQINEEVAIKLIRPEIAADEKTLERFSNELKLARKIAHKNVCKMYHLEKGEETPYISMEYLEGQDLKKLIWEKEKLPPEEAIRIAQQVCEGLVEAHRLGVVHRDLKPQNIMIDKEGQAKIMDFGIARSMEAPGVTQTGVIIGTPDYISPEQAEGREADHRSDIYSLGVILYEMVTGSVPFKGDTALSVALKHKAQLPLDPRKRNPEIPDDLSRLILICMEKDRNRRYQSAKDLLDDLRNIEYGLPLGTKIRPHRQTFVSSLIRKKLFVPVMILVFAFIALAIWQLLPHKETIPTITSDKPALAVLFFQNKTGEAAFDIWKDALPYLLFSDLYPSRLLDVVPDDKITEVLTELDLLETEVYKTQNLEDIAGKAGVSHILKGILTRAGESFRVDVTLQETARMTVIAAEQVSGASENDFYSMVNELTLKIKVALNLSEDQIAGDIDEDVRGITTKSPEALKLYREGRKYYWSDPQRSVELVEKAVEIDPEFAMAYRHLWLCYMNQLFDAKMAGKYREKALEFIDRVSLRERMHIRYITLNLDKRIELAEELLGIYPDDILMRTNLANDMLGPELFDKSAALLEPLIEKRKKEWRTYDLRAWIYLATGEYGKAENVAEIYKQEIAQKDEFFLALAYAYAAQGKKDLAFAELEKMEGLPRIPRTCRVIGWLYVALEDEPGAEKIFRRIFDFDSEAAHLDAWELLASLSCLKGKFDRAEELLREGLKLAEEMQSRGQIRRFQTLLAILTLRRGNTREALETIEKYGFRHPLDGIEIYAAAKQLDKAGELAEKLRKRTENAQSLYHKPYTRDLSWGEGYIALGKEDYDGAASHFRKAQSLMPFPYPTPGILNWYLSLFESLALTYYRSGDLEKAQEEFEKISNVTLGRVASWDIYANSFYMLGKIAEQRGWPGKAIEHPDIFEIEDAKKRLDLLKSRN